MATTKSLPVTPSKASKLPVLDDGDRFARIDLPALEVRGFLTFDVQLPADIQKGRLYVPQGSIIVPSGASTFSLTFTMYPDRLTVYCHNTGITASEAGVIMVTLKAF